MSVYAIDIFIDIVITPTICAVTGLSYYSQSALIGYSGSEKKLELTNVIYSHAIEYKPRRGLGRQ